jgi:hypothetical protein
MQLKYKVLPILQGVDANGQNSLQSFFVGTVRNKIKLNSNCRPTCNLKKRVNLYCAIWKREMLLIFQMAMTYYTAASSHAMPYRLCRAKYWCGGFRIHYTKQNFISQLSDWVPIKRFQTATRNTLPCPMVVSAPDRTIALFVGTP